MRESRNPFRLRAAENIDAELSFLRLFGPGMLDMLGDEELWTRPLIIRSAAGGGKTTLLRLLTPQSLLALHENRGLDETKEVFHRLSSLRIVAESGPLLLGVFLPCTRNYAVLDDLALDAARKDRLFFALLSARIALAALQASLELRQLSYPRDLHRITVRAAALPSALTGSTEVVSGQVIQKWATELEAVVADAIDSFDPWDGTLPATLEPLTTLDLLKPGNLLVDGKPVSTSTLLMLDNVQFLTKRQRSSLFRVLAELRSTVAVWLAERLEALVVDELLGSGTQKGRDYEVLWIEDYWRGKRPRFEKLSHNIADRRAIASIDAEVVSLAPLLEASLDSADWTQRYETLLQELEQRVTQEMSGQTRFTEWMTLSDLADGPVRERVTMWRTLEILVHRERKKVQQGFDFTLGTDEFEEKNDSQVRAAAELFIAQENKLPYYFGPSKLVSLASCNVEQFLWIAGDIFEEIVSAALIRRSLRIAPERQDALLRKASETLWSEIPRRARNSESVVRFLDSIARFAHSMTYLPNAPYDPGVTGIAISMADRERLMDKSYLASRPHHTQVAQVIADSIANNLVEPILDYKCKGERWMVLYLNRLLCPKHWLPLQYGGFKEKSLDELARWVTTGFVATGSLL
jgi:hypothetical protein